ncbi:MAG TPA: hypothetical protein VG537_01720, partial [Candidatus Kapabacteria bacterium]|nr:hypothetical protein [Candidatus Kapabacteria bacterium]
MTSRRSWLIGLALGAALSFGAPSVYAQTPGVSGVPRNISYQGLVLENGVPTNANHTITISYYTAGSP